MKKEQASKPRARDIGNMRPEYNFDYSKAHPNRFAGKVMQDRVVVVLDPDVAKVFTTPEAVNSVLRTLIEIMPPAPKS